MKRILALTLALVVVLALTGCYRANMLDENALGVEDAAPDWGLTLEAEYVTAKGMTLVTHQKGGSEVTGEINTGTPYALKMRQGDTWVDVPQIRDDIAWNTVAYLVPFGGDLAQELNWSQIYGELEAGEYMLVKEYMDFRGTGDYDTFSFSVPFTVE